MCAILPYEFICCYGLSNNILHAFSQPSNYKLADYGIPALTSFAVLHTVCERLLLIQQENFEVVDASSHGATAAMASIPAFLNGAIGITMPDPRHWAEATKSDAETDLLLSHR